MSPQAYATSLIYRGHTPQSVKLATGCDVHFSARRRDFAPANLTPPTSKAVPYGPPMFTPSAKIKAMITNIALKHGITHDELVGRSHAPRFSWPRQEVYFVLHRVLGLSLPRAGAIMGRDHSTVLDGLRKYEKRVRNEKA